MYLLIPLLTLLPSLQGDTRVDQLAAARIDPAHSIQIKSSQLALEPKLGWVSYRQLDGRVVARSLESGEEVGSELNARCIAFRPGHGEAWFGLATGGIVVVPLSESPGDREPSPDGEAPAALKRSTADLKGGPLDLAIEGAVDEIVFSGTGGQFAWRDASTLTIHMVCGVGLANELRTKTAWYESATFEDSRNSSMGGQFTSPGFGFSFDGRFLIYTKRSHANASRGEDGGRVWDLQRGKEVATFRPYISKHRPGFVIAPGSVVYARRDTSFDWSIRSIDLAAPDADTPVDADARGGHFINLSIDRSGRWICECDFEEGAPKIYDLQEERDVRTLGERKTKFLGFDATIEGEAPLVFLTAQSDQPLSVWDVDGNEQVTGIASLKESFPGRASAISVESTLDGRFVVLSCSCIPEEGEKSRHEMRVLRTAK